MSNVNPARKPAILSEAGAHADWIARPFLDAGLELDTCALAEVPERLATGLYNVLLLGRYYTIRKTKQEEEAVVQAVIAAVQTFLEAGGGVFFTLPGGGVLAFDDLIGPYGAQILNLAIDQPEDSIIEGNNEYRIQYAYTTVVEAPFNEGLDGIWYPAMMGSCMATRPVHTSADDGWQSVFCGSLTSRTDSKHVGTGNSVLLPDESLPHYDAAVPIMAVRPVGKGRLAVCGIPSGYYIDSPHSYPQAKQFISEGFNGKPSGLLQFLINTMRWLADPSLQSGALGGGVSGEHVLEPNVPRYPDDPPVIWANREFPPDDPRPLRGLIGARTAYSIGSGTVAEYVEKAKAAGLDFIVFLEDFKALTPEKLQALKADCEALTTEDFFAVPGFTMEDAANSHFFQYGYQLNWPHAELLSPDGKVLTNAGTDANARNSTFEAPHFTLVFDVFKIHCRRGRYLHDQCGAQFEDHRTFDSISLVTWHDGKVLEDVRDRYRLLEDKAFKLNPTVLTFMDAPADVERALASGWRNAIIEPYATMPDKIIRKYMAPELEWWGMIDEEYANTRRFRFDNWQYGSPFQYITSGPQVRAWTASVSSRDPEWRAPDNEIPATADWFRVDVTGFRLRIKVTSEVGLDEVLLYDGQRVIRRWQCNGADVFEQELDLMHHQQMHLGLEARDVNGGTAVCLDYMTLRLDWCEFYCADRNNPLVIGFEKDEKGSAYGWSGTIYLTYNNFQWGGTCCYLGRWWYGGDNIYPVPKSPVYDEIVPSDGGVRTAGAGLHFFTMLPKLDLPELGLVIRPHQEMISTDVSVDSFIIDKGFDPAWPYFHGKERTGFGLYPVQESRYIDIRHLTRVFRPRPYALTTRVDDYELRFKRDPGLTEPMKIGWIDDATNHIFHRLDGTQLELPGKDEQEFCTPWKVGEYLVSWADGRRPAIFINDGVDLELIRVTDEASKQFGPANVHYAQLGVRLPVEHLPKPGGVTRLRFLAVGGPYEMDDPQVGKQMYQAMGMAGDPAYTVEMTDGAILSQRLVLTMDGGGKGVACRIPQVELPMALPVMVQGLNENWPAFLVDRTASRWRPLGMHAGTAYATVDTLVGDWELFIGHPVTASHPEVIINLAQISDEAWMLEVHNPTTEDITVNVTPSPYFTLLDWAGGQFELAAGKSQLVELTGQVKSIVG
ncbi:MAG: hypothetical protein ACYDBB_23490 [Armatimonadota bacterium]